MAERSEIEPRKDRLGISNMNSSLQELMPQMTDREPPTVVEVRPQVKQKTDTPSREKRRITLYNHIRLKDRINLAPEPDTTVQLEQVDEHPYDLSYAYLLIPRFSTHYLIGDIDESLHRWMGQICVSFGWRLDYLTVHPDYIQWIIDVPPSTPPSGCVRIIRQQTSQKIFADFPHYRQENFSKDFWAPGYRVLLGNRPHPPEMINEYILLTRQQQGIPPHRR
jgi:REP element-mobilizing transposase RayT